MIAKASHILTIVLSIIASMILYETNAIVVDTASAIKPADKVEVIWMDIGESRHGLAE